jgi:aminocarboxymuconate-semialdehyde decarboxylase
MRIDVHNHVIPRSALDLIASDKAYETTFPDGAMRCRDSFEFPLSDAFHDPAAKLTELAKHELDAAVLSIAPPAFFYDVAVEKTEKLCEAANEGLADFAAAVPERFRWMAHVPLNDVGRAVPMMRRAKVAGAVGVEIATRVGDLRPDDKAFEPFWAAAEQMELPVMIHPYYNAAYPGLQDWYLQNVIGNPLETMIVGCRLICSGVLDRFPKLNVLLVHGGGHLPYQLGRLRHAAGVREELASAPKDPWAYAGQLKFDTLTHDEGALSYLEDRVGEANVFVGTDLPFDMAPSAPIKMLRSALGEEQARRIAEANPTQFFRFDRTKR